MQDKIQNYKRVFLNPSKREFEKRIASLLKKGTPASEIAKDAAKLSDAKLSDREETGRFLYLAGRHKSLFYFAIESLQSKKPFPWPFLLDVFIQHEITPSPAEAGILFHTWLKDCAGKYPALLACRGWDNISLEFEQIRSFLLEELREKNISESVQLLSQLDFVQSQNLIKEEEKIIAQLLEKEPENQKFRELQKNLEEKKAVILIQKKKQSLSQIRFSEEGKFIPEQKPFKERWFQIISSLADQNPDKAKFLAFFLYFAGWPEKSIKIMEKRISEGANCWFCLDWLMETRQYAASLELINNLLINKQDDPDALFFLNYIKARALYYLGKKSKGIEHLNAILRVRPDYRGAQSLLDRWMKER